MFRFFHFDEDTYWMDLLTLNAVVGTPFFGGSGGAKSETTAAREESHSSICPASR